MERLIHFIPGIMHSILPWKEEYNTGSRIRINSFDLKHPVSPCGDTGTAGKGLLSIFLLGLLGGFIALLTPCVFPLDSTYGFFFYQKQRHQERHMLFYMDFLFS